MYWSRPSRITAILFLQTFLVVAAFAQDSVQAVWRQQHVTFGYRAGDAVHTCAGLRSRLRSLLIALGARDTLNIAVTGCDSGSTTRIVSVDLASPVEATEENLRAITRYDARAQLAARVRGEPLPDATTLERFPAQWQTLSFANALYLRLTPADCELLRQMEREMMPKLSVRVMSDRMRCPSNLSGGFRPQLVVAALVRAD